MSNFNWSKVTDVIPGVKGTLELKMALQPCLSENSLVYRRFPGTQSGGGFQ